MEFYRKLCNKLYWKHLEPGTASYRTRIWLIFMSAISMIWLALFYNPTDPANLRSYSNMIKKLSVYFRRLSSHVINTLSQINIFRRFKFQLTPYYQDTNNIILWKSSMTYLKVRTILI